MGKHNSLGKVNGGFGTELKVEVKLVGCGLVAEDVEEGCDEGQDVDKVKD